MKKIAVVLAEGFEICEAMLPVDIWKRGGLEVKTFSIQEVLEVQSSASVILLADEFFQEDKVKDFDALFLPGGVKGAENLSKNATLKKVIDNFQKDGKWVTAICASPAKVLGEQGFLEGRDFTCYPGFEKLVNTSEHFYKPREDFIISKPFITSAGLGHAAPFALKVLELLSKKEIAELVKNQILWP